MPRKEPDPERVLDSGYVEDRGPEGELFGCQTLLNGTRHGLVLVSTVGTSWQPGSCHTIVAPCVAVAPWHALPGASERRMSLRDPNARHSATLDVADPLLSFWTDRRNCRLVHEAIVFFALMPYPWWNGRLVLLFDVDPQIARLEGENRWGGLPPRTDRWPVLPWLQAAPPPPVARAETELEYDPWT